MRLFASIRFITNKLESKNNYSFIWHPNVSKTKLWEKKVKKEDKMLQAYKTCPNYWESGFKFFPDTTYFVWYVSKVKVRFVHSRSKFHWCLEVTTSLKNKRYIIELKSVILSCIGSELMIAVSSWQYTNINSWNPNYVKWFCKMLKYVFSFWDLSNPYHFKLHPKAALFKLPRNCIWNCSEH